MSNNMVLKGLVEFHQQQNCLRIMSNNMVLKGGSNPKTRKSGLRIMSNNMVLKDPLFSILSISCLRIMPNNMVLKMRFRRKKVIIMKINEEHYGRTVGGIRCGYDIQHKLKDITYI